MIRFAWLKGKRSMKENKLPVSAIATECACCTSSIALQREFADMSIPADYNTLNAYERMQTQTAWLEVERKKTQALMEARRRSFVR